MYRCSLLLIYFFFLAPFSSMAQQEEVPAELKAFVLPGHELLDWKTGDINQDQRMDAILICRQSQEDSIWDEFMPRPFLILIRQADGKLKQLLRNDKAIMGRHDGGVWGDPYQSLNLFTGGFSFSFYGGSNWRWVYEYNFRWNPVRKQWLLTHESSGSFNSMDMEGTMKNTEIEADELGDWPFEKFSFDGMHQQSRWKVIAAKTYFYDQPEIGGPRRKGYLVKGNIAEGSRTLKHFVELSFDNGKEISTGFILKKDLQQLPLQKQKTP